MAGRSWRHMPRCRGAACEGWRRGSSCLVLLLDESIEIDKADRADRAVEPFLGGSVSRACYYDEASSRTRRGPGGQGADCSQHVKAPLTRYLARGVFASWMGDRTSPVSSR